MNIKNLAIIGLASGLLAASCAINAPAAELKVGDTTEAVVRELGKPTGRITSGKYEVFLYDRGKVELQDGHIISLELISTEEATTRRLERERRQKEAEQWAREASERRRLEGTRLLAERQADTNFRAKSAGEQLAYWDVFKNQYPEIDIGAIYASLSQQYQREVEQARLREQLADLQQRTAAAEARAAQAERAAAQATEDAYWANRNVTYISWPYVQNYQPAYQPPPTCNTPHEPAVQVQVEHHTPHNSIYIPQKTPVIKKFKTASFDSPTNTTKIIRTK